MNEYNVLCLVGAHRDESFALHAEARPGLSVPSRRTRSVGGCALNVAAGLATLGARAMHAGLRGEDSDGEAVAAALARYGVQDRGIVLPDQQTGTYAALINPDGTLALATAAMGIYAHANALLDHAPFLEGARQANVMVLDANADPATIIRLASSRGKRTRLALLATSADKVARLAPVMAEADMLFSNEAEWACVGTPPRIAFVTDGANGVRVLERGEPVGHVPASGTVMGDVIGAGDAFSAGTLHAWLGGAAPLEAAANGVALAARAIARHGALGWLDGSSVADTLSNTDQRL